MKWKQKYRLKYRPNFLFWRDRILFYPYKHGLMDSKRFQLFLKIKKFLKRKKKYKESDFHPIRKKIDIQESKKLFIVRDIARKQKKYKIADKIKNKLLENGFTIKDSEDDSILYHADHRIYFSLKTDVYEK